jgi:hypothetical protein
MYLAVVPSLVLHNHLEQIRAKGKPIGGAVSKRGRDKRKRRTDGYVAAGSVVKLLSSGLASGAPLSHGGRLQEATAQADGVRGRRVCALLSAVGPRHTHAHAP